MPTLVPGPNPPISLRPPPARCHAGGGWPPAPPPSHSGGAWAPAPPPSGAPPQPPQPFQPPAPPHYNPNGPPQPNAEPEPIDPDELLDRAGFGLLLGALAIVLCCLPVGIFGALFPLSVYKELPRIPDPAIQTRLRKRATLAIILCATATLLALVAYTFAFAAGCR